MTKILYVRGDDYAAVNFNNAVDEGLVTASELWEENVGRVEVGVYDINDDYFEYEALEFGDVDPDFFAWVRDIRDHDDSKHADFYVVEVAS